MFDCCANNRYNCGPFYNGCPPMNFCCRRSRSTEFPKQTGPFIEEKFSNYNPPSFLCNTDPPKARVKTRSCSCSTKYPKVSKNCTCKAKGITDCRKTGKEDGKRICEKTCEANEKDAAKGMAGKGARGTSRSADNPTGTTEQVPTNTIYQGPNGSSITLDNRPIEAANSGMPVYDLGGQGNPINPVAQQQQLSDMPAAGLPTRQIPKFDPCTGRECQQPLQIQGAAPSGLYGMPMTCMCPYFCPIQCYPCPPMQLGYGPPTAINNSNENETNKEQANSESDSKDKSEKSEKSKNERNKTRLLENEKSGGKEREIAKTNKGKRRNSLDNQTKLINCSNASPELIQRICDSLQISHPPDCYVLLPITMASKQTSKSKVRDDPSPKKIKSSGNVAKKKPTDTESSSAEDATVPKEPKAKKENTPACKPTRNCGCNTTISGKYEEKKETCQEEPPQNSCSPGGACCTSGCCYPRPRYTYCYNPCTGCFYWRKKCCCCACNGCCNNNNNGGGGGGGSCPITKQGSNSSGSKSPSIGSPQLKKNRSNDSSRAKVSSTAKDKRSSAGAMSAFQPGVQELYDQWLGFQQHAVFPPMMPPSQPQQHQSQQSQQGTFMNGTGINSQSQDLSRFRDESKYQLPDIDWTPQ